VTAGPVMNTLSLEKGLYQSDGLSPINWYRFGHRLSLGFLLYAICSRYDIYREISLERFESGNGLFQIFSVLFFAVTYVYLEFQFLMKLAEAGASLFGISPPANFLAPFAGNSPAEFWRRWHITLTDWFRMYVYVPILGFYLRVPVLKRIFSVNIWSRISLVCVWVLVGLWHGFSMKYFVYGILNGIAVQLPFERWFPQGLARMLGRFATWLIVAMTLLLFVAPDIRYFLDILKFFSRADFLMSFDLQQGLRTWVHLLPLFLGLWTLNWFERNEEALQGSKLASFLTMTCFLVLSILLYKGDHYDAIYSGF
jgi:D-alanyl-lipoteichoic acid acyltransferase DltB (MBOAT superfamily)